MKVFEWISEISECLIKKEGLDKVGRKESEEEEMLLEDYCSQVPPSRIEMESNMK
jgi:hypothetical protein